MRSIASPVLAATVALLLASCAITFVDPPAQPANPPVLRTSVTTNVPVKIAITPLWFEPGSFGVWEQTAGDGGTPGVRDLSPLFTLVRIPQGVWQADGIVPLAPGDHELRTVACWGVNVNVVFVKALDPPPRGCRISIAYVKAFTPVVSVLPGTVALDIGSNPMATLSIRLEPPPSVDTTVTLASPLIDAQSVVVPAGQAAAVNSAPLTGRAVGAGSLTASAPSPWGSATVAVSVRPVLTAASPNAGSVGTTVTLAGAGFASGMQVRFGAASASASVQGPTAATVVVPQLAPQATTIAVVQPPSNVESRTLPFTVQPTPTGVLLHRSHSSGVEVFRFTPASPIGSFAQAASAPSTLSPGLAVVGLARNGTLLARSGSQSLDLWTTGGTLASPTLTAGGRAPTTGSTAVALTGDGTSVSIVGGNVVRGTNFGLEVWAPGPTPLVRLGVSPLPTGTPATASQTLLADPVHAGRLFRSTPSALEVWDVSTPSAPTLQNANMNVFAAQLVTGLAWVTPGQRLVRSHANGVQLLDVVTGSNNKPNTQVVPGGGNITGGGIFGGLVVVGGSLVARGTGDGLEVYALQPSGAVTKCGIDRRGDAGASGVAVAVQGDIVFRTTGTSIEAYSLAGLTCPTTNVTTQFNPALPFAVLRTPPLATSTTGLGLSGP
jgi:hypothetical protein